MQTGIPITQQEMTPGDQIDIVSDIRRYDIVCFERVGEGRVIIRALTPVEASTYPGTIYQVDKDETQEGSILFNVVE